MSDQRTPWAWSPGPTAIDDHFELWATRVEELVGRPIDRKAARTAFETYQPPTKALTPEEYAWELQNHNIGRDMLREMAVAMWGDDGKIYLPGEAGYPSDSRVVQKPDSPEPTRASREPPRIWKPDAPVQRIINWIWRLTGTRP